MVNKSSLISISCRFIQKIFRVNYIMTLIYYMQTGSLLSAAIAQSAPAFQRALKGAAVRVGANFYCSILVALIAHNKKPFVAAMMLGLPLSLEYLSQQDYSATRSSKWASVSRKFESACGLQDTTLKAAKLHGFPEMLNSSSSFATNRFSTTYYYCNMHQKMLFFLSPPTLGRGLRISSNFISRCMSHTCHTEVNCGGKHSRLQFQITQEWLAGFCNLPLLISALHEVQILMNDILLK